MKGYKVDNIRNIALLGHGGCGKTTLMESVLFNLGVTKRMGKVEDGNTVSDYDKEEIARKFSIGTSLVPVEYNESKYNFLDTPGYFDFVGEVNGALKVAGGAVIVIDASSGIEVGTEKAWHLTEKYNMPKLIYINKMDKENIDYMKLMNDLKDKFGKKVAPFCIPIGEEHHFTGFINVVDMCSRIYDGKECASDDVPAGYEDQIQPVRDMLMEAVAESDEMLMEKYFEGQEFTRDEIHMGLRKGVVAGDVVPVIVGSAHIGVGIHTLLEMIYDYLPTPYEMTGGEFVGTNPETEAPAVRKASDDEAFSAFVFKTIVDPFVGKISLFKVYSGIINKDTEVLNANRDEVEKVASLFFLRGKTQVPLNYVTAGDIAATAKLQYTKTGDTLCDKSKPIIYDGIKNPKPCIYMAVEPKEKGDEEKIGTSLQRLKEEDPSFEISRNVETKQLLIGGQGNMQLGIVISKLKNIFSVEVDLVDQKIAYRETIKGSATVQGKHKKQSGGSGQYGDVHVKFEHTDQEFIFEEKIFGGSVPRQYIPAVEKGIRESMDKGVLAGFKVVNVKATLVDGSYHDVDSNEMAFRTAAHLAFKKGIQESKPVLLEPIMKVQIHIPDQYMGDIMGDMNKRRGRILGMEPDDEGYQKVMAEAPQAEMFKYALDLRSMTQARGYFEMEFTRYDEVPQPIALKVIEDNKRHHEE